MIELFLLFAFYVFTSQNTILETQIYCQNLFWNFTDTSSSWVWDSLTSLGLFPFSAPNGRCCSSTCLPSGEFSSVSWTWTRLVPVCSSGKSGKGRDVYTVNHLQLERKRVHLEF
jgi:hypothetical protein